MTTTTQVKRILALLLCCLFAAAGAGCWDQVELDELGLVTAVGIDLAERPGELLVTAQMLRPGIGGKNGGGSSQGGAYWVGQSPGFTVFDAIRNMTLVSSRKLYFAHNQIVIIGKEAAEQGVRQYLDMFLRDEEMRPTVWLAVTEGKASDILQADSGFEQVPGLELARLIEVRFATSKVVATTLQQFAQKLLSKHGNPTANMVELYEVGKFDPETGLPSGSHITASGQAESDQSQKKSFRLSGTAVFKGDTLVGSLQPVETRGLHWLIGEVQSGIIVVESSKDKGKVALEILNATSKLEPVFSDAGLTMRAKVQVEVNLGSQRSQDNFITTEGTKELGALVAEAVKYEATLAFKKAQEMRSDIFGFGSVIRRADKRRWKHMKEDWDEIFPNMQLAVEVEAKVARFGLINKPLAPPK